MPSPEQIRDAGPWAVLAFVLIALGVFLWRSIQSKAIVPGWILERTETDRQTVLTQASRNAEAIEAMSASMKSMTASDEATAAAVRDLVASVRELTIAAQSQAQSYQAMARLYDSLERRVDTLANAKRVNDV